MVATVVGTVGSVMGTAGTVNIRCVNCVSCHEKSNNPTSVAFSWQIVGGTGIGGVWEERRGKQAQ